MKNAEIIDGLLVEPNLHDARICGLRMHEDRDLIVSVEATSGPPLLLFFQGVSRLLVNNFREGNIILDITVLSGDEIEVSDVEIFYDLHGGKMTDAITALLNGVKSEGKIIVKVASSYGCQIFCICEKILFGDAGKL